MFLGIHSNFIKTTNMQKKPNHTRKQYNIYHIGTVNNWVILSLFAHTRGASVSPSEHVLNICLTSHTLAWFDLTLCNTTVTVVDCELSNTWSDWGDCSVLCGLGVKERRRHIIRHPQNGGKVCQATDTIQRAVCEGITCKLPRAVSPAMLLQLRGNFHVEYLF